MKIKERRKSTNIVDITGPNLTSRGKAAAYLTRNIKALSEPENQVRTERDIDEAQNMARPAMLKRALQSKAKSWHREKH